MALRATLVLGSAAVAPTDGRPLNVRSDGLFADLSAQNEIKMVPEADPLHSADGPLRVTLPACLSAQNEIRMVPEAEHIEEAVLNSFDDIITAAQSVDDISVKVWGIDSSCAGRDQQGERVSAAVRIWPRLQGKVHHDSPPPPSPPHHSLAPSACPPELTAPPHPASLTPYRSPFSPPLLGSSCHLLPISPLRSWTCPRSASSPSWMPRSPPPRQPGPTSPRSCTRTCRQVATLPSPSLLPVRRSPPPSPCTAALLVFSSARPFLLCARSLVRPSLRHTDPAFPPPSSGPC